MKENEVYQIWGTKHIEYKKRTEDKIIFKLDFIETLPKSIKPIIAYYSTRISPYTSINREYDVSQTLGNYSTLQEAQAALLKDWKYSETLLHVKPSDNRQQIDLLYTMKTESGLLFWYQKIYDQQVNADEFKITKDGEISHIKHYENVAIDKATNKPKLQ